MSITTFGRRLQYLIPSDNEEWLKEMRGNLAMVATMVANASFQMGLNPPGGVVKDSSNYQTYLWINNVSFYTSVITCVWLVSGTPIKPGLPTLCLSTLMIVCLGLLAISYSLGALIVTPHGYPTLYGFLVLLFLFVVLVSVFQIARFLAIFIIRNPDVDNHAHQK